MRTVVFGGVAWRRWLASLPRSSAPRPEALRAAAGIVRAVRRGGDAALCRLTARFDGVRLLPRQLRVPPREIAVWIGPAIGHHAFEVGRDVLDAFCVRDPDAASYFAPQRDGKWHADLAGLARRALAALGVHDVAVHGGCTYSEPTRYFSYRRDRASGRMALVAWLAAAAPPRSTPPLSSSRSAAARS